jgi:glycosyltransferase involved in cell wall biosynthesis
VVTVSDFNLAWLRERFPRAAGRLHRIYNGLLLEQFPFPPPPRRARTIVSVGRLIEKKGFDQLIDACALLAADGVGFDCAIVGTGELEEALAARIARLGLGARVRLLGSRPRSEVIEIVRGAALFAGPYTIAADGNRDGLPTVLTEAMALGTPCVASAVTGVPEIVEDGVTGLLVPPDDVAALAAAIRRLLDAPALGERLARAARQRVEERFDARRSSAALRALFAPARPGEAIARAS